MKKQVSLSFSIDEAKIIFDALSSHRYKILTKKDTLSDELNTNSDDDDHEEKQEFVNQRIMAIESEVEKTNQIFEKIGEYVKEVG